MEMEIQTLLERLVDVNEEMGRCAAAAAPASSIAQKLARHRDILHEFTQVSIHLTSLIPFPSFFVTNLDRICMQKRIRFGVESEGDRDVVDIVQCID